MEIIHPGTEAAQPNSVNHSTHDNLPVFNTTDCTILVVDDDMLIREFIKLILGKEGFNNLEFADNGQTGLELFRENKPDLVILDVHMPKLDGHEFLKIVRADRQYDNIPIIIQTADNTLENRNKILHAGATNILSKPLDPLIVLDRVKTHLQNRLLVHNLQAYQNRLQHELDAARQMQQQLLPKEKNISNIEATYDAVIDWHYQPSSELGGDWWGTGAVDDDKFYVYVADFTGHGVGSAINTFRLNMMMQETSTLSGAPDRQLSALNDQLHDVLPVGQFATMMFAMIDTGANTLTYASAGHTAPLLIRGNGQIDIGNSRGLPLGIKKSVDYTIHHTELNKGDALFIYSDALIETPGLNGPELETGGLVQLIEKQIGNREHNRPLENLIHDFYAFARFPVSDDTTAIWVERNKT